MDWLRFSECKKHVFDVSSLHSDSNQNNNFSPSVLTQIKYEQNYFTFQLKVGLLEPTMYCIVKSLDRRHSGKTEH